MHLVYAGGRTEHRVAPIVRDERHEFFALKRRGTADARGAGGFDDFGDPVDVIVVPVRYHDELDGGRWIDTDLCEVLERRRHLGLGRTTGIGDEPVATAEMD